MGMILPVDNFWYFLVLFTIAVVAGTYLLFAYYVNRLLIANVIVLYLSSWRVATEYYIQQLPTYQQLIDFQPWHGLPLAIYFALQWSMIWFYVRPLRGWRFESLINNSVVGVAFVLPNFFFGYYYTFDPQMFTYAQEQVNGLWAFAVNLDFSYRGLYDLYLLVSLFVLLSTLCFGVYQQRSRRLLRSMLVVTYLLAIFLYFSMTKSDGLNVPTTGILYVTHSLIISWYVSGYRLFRSNISLMTRDLFDSISDLTISTDAKFRITNVNDNTSTVFGEASGDVLKFLKRHSPTAKRHPLAGVEQVIRGVIPSWELQLVDRQDKERDFRLKVSPLTVGEDLIGYTFLLSDLTEMLEKERRLTELNSNKDRLFGIIGHDLRRPALAFRDSAGSISYLIEREDYSGLKKFTGSLQEEAITLNRLTKNLLEWGRVQSGVLAPKVSEVNLGELVATSIEQLEYFAKRKEIVVKNILPAGTTVVSDQRILEPAIRNLLDNAIKFSVPKSEITINLTEVAGSLSINVHDTGKPLARERLTELMHGAAYKIGAGTFGEKGSGIGLRLVRDLLAQVGGHLAAANSSHGGNVFSIVLPTAGTTNSTAGTNLTPLVHK